MKNSKNIFEKTRCGFDINVWRLFMVISILAAVLLSFKVYKSSDLCQLYDIIINRQMEASKSYEINESIVFSAVGTDSKDITWDYGDHLKAKGRSVMHSYSVEGNYNIVATANGKCVQTITISVVRPVLQKSTSSNVMASPILGPEAPIAASPVNFTCSVPAASYEWTVLNSPNFQIQKTAMATFTFPSPGTRVIELKLDGDPNKVYRKSIQVISTNDKIDAAAIAPIVVLPDKRKLNIVDTPKSRPLNGGSNGGASNGKPALADNTKAAIKKLIIPDEEFKRMFEDVIKGNINADKFNDFLCNGASTKVMANNKWTTLGELCAAIYKQKKTVIKELSIERDTENCVAVIRIQYKKKWL
ncbi:MAG TPA: PKD domain-containing protein [Arachidicoccus sp.]|nr:PKD domain-containing protein [Arachidicoccus sp.]